MLLSCMQCINLERGENCTSVQRTFQMIVTLSIQNYFLLYKIQKPRSIKYYIEQSKSPTLVPFSEEKDCCFLQLNNLRLYDLSSSKLFTLPAFSFQSPPTLVYTLSRHVVLKRIMLQTLHSKTG